MKSFILLPLAAALSFAMAPASAALKDGTYTSTVNGHNAPLTVKVTIANNKIENIDISKNLETIGVGKLALNRLAKHIKDTQSVNVDNVTGATLSSFAIKKGVRDCLTQAGADKSEFNKKVDVYPTNDETLKTQIVIVGGGGAGLAAAVSAVQNGAKVVVLEKLGYLGGSTNVSGGAFNAVDPKRQGAMGIEDSVNKFYEQTMKGGHNVGNPELVHYLTDNAMKSVEWLESLGADFKDKIGTATGALWQRSHYGTTPAGNHYIRALEKFLAEHKDDATIITDADVKSLIQDKGGRITGVVANNHGRKITVLASKGVVLATGGFGANVELRRKVNTGVWKEVDLGKGIGASTIQKSAQGDGIALGQKAGADVIGMSDIQLHPCGTPGTGLMEHIRTSGRNRLFVNELGDRFVNEGAARDTLCKAIFAQPHSTYWLVVNHVRYPARDWVDRNGATIADMASLGAVVEANTLDELAKKTGMDAAKLKASVDEYNKVATGKVEKDKYGFVANNKEDRPMTEGPWYAVKKVPTVHHTMGGLRINTQTQVLDHNGKPLPGLYAAGEVTGGIHGANRLGGNAIADIFTFGRQAGKVAAESK
ncbi:flavocytochrome c [Parasutterella muris]|uniref:Urocanate reductase n=3 Tax=Sutterellaceae TaxID=995019 RepID=A0A6L6YII6_9BURK|nr:flavocytochrome c [Parasutterella muris]MVX57500.1 flavocytochrome c [Parasutterella muris]